MANFTCKAIKETFMELLEEKPLSEITVKDIVEGCGINRNSFYYHYQDLPALIEEIIEEQSNYIIDKYPSVNAVVECFDALIEYSSSRKRAIMHIYHSVNREVFEKYLMYTSEYFVRTYINTALGTLIDAGISVEDITEEDKKSIINYYKCVCFGLVIDWLDSGMTEEKAQSTRRIFSLKKDMADEIAEMLKGQV